MSVQPSTFEITSPAKPKKKFNLSFDHIGTCDFGNLKPIATFMTVPDDTFNINISQFTRLMPMPCPTFGTIDNTLRAFFVPFRTVMRDWNDFISHKIRPQSSKPLATPTLSSPYVPTVSIGRIVQCFVLSAGNYSIFTPDSFPGYEPLATAVNDGQPWDFRYANQSGTPVTYYSLTPSGRRVYDILNSLGLHISLDYPNGIPNPSLDTDKVSLLPLLSLWRCYLDWYVPSRFLDLPQYVAIQNLFSQSFTNDTFGQPSNDNPALMWLLQPMSAFYDPDYFTSAFISPYGPENQLGNFGTLGSFVVPESTQSSEGVLGGTFQSVPQVGGDRFDTVVPLSPETSAGVWTQTGNNNEEFYAIQMYTLGALQDMVNLGKITGGKIQDYLQATYGIRPSTDALGISTHLGAHKSSIQIGDVMATAGTSENALGQYAGRGLGYDENATWQLDAKEHGMIIIFQTLDVKASYPDGLNPDFLRINPVDYYQPQLDSMGVDPIRQIELISNNDTGQLPDFSGIFGWTPRYSNYKVKHDNVSGDFRVKTLNTGLDSWYLQRRFGGVNPSNLYINLDFTKSTTDIITQNLDYIFNDATNDADHFYCIWRIQCTAYRPMLPLSEAFDPVTMDKRGQKMNVDFQGTVL